MKSGPAPTWDPLGYGVELPLQRNFYPLGFAVEISTNSEEVLEAAEESWPSREASFPDQPLRLRILVSATDEGETPPDPLFRAQGHLMTLVADSRHFATCDFETGFAFAWLDQATIQRRRYFRFHYLESIAYALLTHRRLTPIHASCVAFDGRGALLCGKPGSGKSCLAFACARAGLTFVTDDAGYLVRSSYDRTVLGIPHYVRFLTSAAEIFPELQGLPSRFDVHGGTLLEVRTDGLPGLQISSACRAEHVIFLKREIGGETRLSTVDSEEALAWLVQELPCFETRVRREQLSSLERLVENPVHSLRYSELGAAVEQIRSLLQ